MTSSFDFDTFFAGVSTRWPQKGDRLLRGSVNWKRTVDLAQNSVARHSHQWSGYMTAGSLLVKACEQHPSERHFLVYPILYNYRQGLELAIKWMIDRYGPYCHPANAEDTNHHDLLKLWRICREILREIGGEGEATPHVEQIIKDFHEIDPSGTSFRYSHDKNDNLIDLPDQAIDIENIRDVMEGVDNFFTGADGQLDSYVPNIDYDY